MTDRYYSIKKRYAAAALLMAASAWTASLHAVPAYPGVIEITQPDGSTLEIVQKGDERGHRVYSSDGYLLMHDADGYLTYAVADTEGLPVASAWRATDPGERGEAERKFLSGLSQPEVADAFGRMERMNVIAREAGESPRLLCSGAAFPSNGSPRALVVLVEYQDKNFTMADPKDFYERMLNEEGFGDYNATGSVRDFFVENSGGVFTPQFDVYGPVKLKYNYSYYGANDYSGNDCAPEEMVIEACSQLDGTVDFSIYDTNDDGQIDNVFIFYAGYGEADSKITSAVWPHSADIKDYDLGEDYYFDGKLLNRYACTCEMDYPNRRPGGIGTFVHEFSHVMGLPDLYATTYSSSFTPGAYSTLDMGPYNNQGRTPPHYSVFERYCLDWLQPEVISESGDYTLEAIHKSNRGFLIPTDRDDEFYLLENRQQECCDAYIPGHGMMVWHIDYLPIMWNRNIVNNTPSHQYVDLVEADNRRTDATRAGDPFPGQNNVRILDGTSTPALRAWSGNPLAVGISNIIEKNGVINFSAAVDLSGISLTEDPGRGDVRIDGRSVVNLSGGVAHVYDLSGVRVATLESGADATLPAGMYILSSEKERRKICLR